MCGMHLYMALYKAFHAQKNRLRPGLVSLGLSPGQPKVLARLAEAGPCRQKEIAAALDIEPATISHILDNMEQEHLVRRTPTPECRRGNVSLTERGEAAYGEWRKLCEAVEQDALRGFTEEEGEQFRLYLGRMYRNLTEKN